MSGYPAIPSHEANMPNFLQATSDYSAFYTKLQNTPDLDLTAELAKLKATLQLDFDTTQPAYPVTIRQPRAELRPADARGRVVAHDRGVP
jgi:hypothetical protein